MVIYTQSPRDCTLLFSLSNTLGDCNDPQFCRVVLLFSHPLGSPFQYLRISSPSPHLSYANPGLYNRGARERQKSLQGFSESREGLSLYASARSLSFLACLNGGICAVRVESPNPAGILTRSRASDPRFEAFGLERSPGGQPDHATRATCQRPPPVSQLGGGVGTDLGFLGYKKI